MSNRDGHRADLQRTSALNEPQSRDALDWGLLRTLNERCLELMMELAKSDPGNAPPAVALNRELWCSLEAVGWQRAADVPLLLLDSNFADPVWWAQAAEQRTLERDSGSEGYLRADVVAELMRETLTLAWIVARVDRGSAIIFCGMAPSVATLFASFSPSDLERLSTRYHHHLRLRFDDHPSYWRMHLKIFGSKSVCGAPHREVPEQLQQSLF